MSLVHPAVVQNTRTSEKPDDLKKHKRTRYMQYWQIVNQGIFLLTKQRRGKSRRVDGGYNKNVVDEVVSREDVQKAEKRLYSLHTTDEP